MTVVLGEDGVQRCAWAAVEPETAYHDAEWGFPVDDDIRLYEKICLEGFQSGLSWRTILVKRENFRAGFAGFDFNVVAGFGAKDIARLLGDTGIVRHRGKIEATINNAGRAVEMVEKEGSLATYFWAYEDAIVDRDASAMSKDLKKRGWRFVGPTTAYAFAQAMGLVNDHDPDCAIHTEVARSRKKFKRP